MTWFKKLVGNRKDKISRGSIIRSCLLMLFLLLFTEAFPLSSYAQENPRPWRETLNCAPSDQNFKGIEYCTGLNGKAHVLVIDLHEPDVGFEYVIAEGNDRDYTFGECQDVNLPQWSSGSGCYDPLNSSFYPIMSLLDAVNRYPETAAVINTDYGATDQERGHGPEGFTVIHGNRIDGSAIGDTDNNAEKRPWLAISQNPPLRAEFDQYDIGGDDGGKPGWVYTGVGGAPWLIQDGQIDDDQINNCTNATQHSCVSDYAQTAMALSQDGRWLYLVVIEGADANGTAQFLYRTLQPWQAIKMDGGGSSQLWYRGKRGNNPEDHVIFAGDGRKLSQYLAIFAESGSGIIDDSSSTPPNPVEEDDFLQNIRDSIREWWADNVTARWEDIQANLADSWEETMSDLEEQIEELFADLEQKLAAWFENQFTTFFDQLCGIAMLPVGGTFFWWIKRNRKMID